MRKIVEDKTGFVDKTTAARIMCAFSLGEDCRPECAACSIWGLGPKVSCQRGEGEVFLIGIYEV